MRVLLVALGPPDTFPSSRIRAGGLVKYLRSSTPGLEVKLIYKPGLTRPTARNLLGLAFQRIWFWLQFAWYLRRAWDVIEALQVFFPRWVTRALARRARLVLDITDFGTFLPACMAQRRAGASLVQGLFCRYYEVQRERMLAMSEHCHAIFANAADVAPPYVQPFAGKMHALLDPVDVDRYRPRQAGPPVVVGWTGSPGTAYFVNQIAPVLCELKAQFEDAIEILLFGAPVACFDTALRAVARIEEWDASREVELTTRIDIGLLPAPDDDLARHKEPYKLLLYYAVGAPVVATPVGMVPFLVREGETGFCVQQGQQWREALSRLLTDTPLRHRMGREARQTAEDQFSYRTYAQRWLGLISPK
jgi:glycosyltransferase involved in cell wall biosynthesis